MVLCVYCSGFNQGPGAKGDPGFPGTQGFPGDPVRKVGSVLYLRKKGAPFQFFKMLPHYCHSSTKGSYWYTRCSWLPWTKGRLILRFQSRNKGGERRHGICWKTRTGRAPWVSRIARSQRCPGPSRGFGENILTWKPYKKNVKLLTTCNLSHLHSKLLYRPFSLAAMETKVFLVHQGFWAGQDHKDTLGQWEMGLLDLQELREIWGCQVSLGCLEFQVYKHFYMNA